MPDAGGTAQSTEPPDFGCAITPRGGSTPHFNGGDVGYDEANRRDSNVGYDVGCDVGCDVGEAPGSTSVGTVSLAFCLGSEPLRRIGCICWRAGP